MHITCGWLQMPPDIKSNLLFLDPMVSRRMLAIKQRLNKY